MRGGSIPNTKTVIHNSILGMLCFLIKAENWRRRASLGAGCVLQCYVLLLNPSIGSNSGAIISIGISAFMTGLTSAMIAYDVDTSELQRRKQPKFYGYIKNGSEQRGRTFFLMTMISTLHSFSRSLGYAILAVVDLNLALKYFVGEVGAYILYKVCMKDYYCRAMVDGALSVVVTLLARIMEKVAADFTVSNSKREPASALGPTTNSFIYRVSCT